MQLRLFVPAYAKFNDIYGPLRSKAGIVEQRGEFSCVVPLRNENHQDSYVFDLHKKDSRDLERPPKFSIAESARIDRVSDEIAIIGSNGFRLSWNSL